MPGSPHPLWERWRCIQLLVVLNSLRCWLELFESLVFGFVWSLWTPFPVVFSHFFFIEVSSKTWKPLRPFPTYQNWRMMQNDECCVSISHIRVCLMKTMWRVREEYEDLIHRFFSKSHQEEQFPFATSTHFSFFQAMISLSVIPCPRAPWQQGGARFLRKPHRCAKTIRLQQVHRPSMEAFHLRELRSFILNEVLYIFDIFIFDFVLFIKWFIFVGTQQPRCRSTAAATGPWPGAKVFSDHGNAQEGVEHLKCKKESFEVASKLHCIRQLEKQISVQGWLGWLWVFWGLPGGDPCAPAPGATERETAHGEAPCTTTTTRQGIECWIAYDDCRRSIILATNGLWPQHLVKTATLKSNSWCQYTAISGYMWMITMYRWVGRKQREILNFRPLLWCVVQDWCIRLNKR